MPTITHAFTNPKADGADATVVRPSDWNAVHTVDATTLSGYSYDYATSTSPVSLTGSTEGTANTVITGGTVAYDGATEVLIAVYIPHLESSTTSGASSIALLYEDSTLLGRIGIVTTTAAATARTTVSSIVKRTPSNASHQYIVKAYSTAGTGIAGGGAGGTADYVAGFLRVTRA
jgi:hypothetical protein